jgi:6-phosphogluconolactonase
MANSTVFYLGTYTSPGGSQGIYHASLNLTTGEISTPELAIEARDPSFVAYHPNGKYLYTVHESTAGEFSAYAIQADHSLKLLNKVTAPVPGPCHLSVDPSGRHLFTAGYGTGVLASLPISPNGTLGAASWSQQNTGHGPNTGRQEGPHMHAAYPNAKGDLVYACDLGTDEVLVYKLDKATGKLTAAQPKSVLTEPGSGPRHLALSPNGQFAYVNGELTSTVLAYRVDPATGALTHLQTLSTLPAEHGNNSTAEIHVHPNGKWLYVSNRGHDSIAAYAIHSDGKLTLLEIEPATVREPRGFDLEPTGHWLVVAGQNSNNLTALAIDQTTGKLTPTHHLTPISKPVCVVIKKS